MGSTRVLFLGDVVMSGGMADNVSPEIHRLIHSHDLVVPNLEGVFRPPAGPVHPRGVLHEGSPSSVFNPDRTLFFLGNNHIGDAGRAGLLSTLESLSKEGFASFGAKNRYSAERCDIDFFGMGWEPAGCPTDQTIGVMPLSQEVLVAETLKRSRAKARVVVLHWGLEFERLPLPAHRDLAHRLVDAGANLIIGHHPHCVQAREVYRGASIFYSLGNFYFEQKRYGEMNVRYPLMSNIELAVSVEITANGVSANPVSLYFDRDTSRLSLDIQGRAEKVLEQHAGDVTGPSLAYELRYRLLKSRRTLPTFSGRPGSLPYETAGWLLKIRKGAVALAIRTGLKRGYRRRD